MASVEVIPPKRYKYSMRTIDFNEQDLKVLNRSSDVKNNTVHTSKYNMLTFLPVNLFEQFTKKVANIYFLVIMFMQMISVISISNGQPAMAPPLIFVILLSMCKDAYEDYKKKKADEKENNAFVEVFKKSEDNFFMKQWKKIKVGDVVRVKEDCYFPADMIIINSTEKEGMFYVETKNLDGETNLKIKGVEKDLIEPFSIDGGFSKL